MPVLNIMEDIIPEGRLMRFLSNIGLGVILAIAAIDAAVTFDRNAEKVYNTYQNHDEATEWSFVLALVAGILTASVLCFAPIGGAIYWLFIHQPK